MAACRDAVAKLPSGIDSPGAVAAMTSGLAARVDAELTAVERP
jgi:hypothetical protein